jgi:hypothetical protein
VPDDEEVDVGRGDLVASCEGAGNRVRRKKGRRFFLVEICSAIGRACTCFDLCRTRVRRICYTVGASQSSSTAMPPKSAARAAEGCSYGKQAVERVREVPSGSHDAG